VFSLACAETFNAYRGSAPGSPLRRTNAGSEDPASGRFGTMSGKAAGVPRGRPWRPEQL